jgi:hypothetical protein
MTKAQPRPGEARTDVLVAGSAVGGVTYDARGPSGTPAAVGAAGSLILLGRTGASITSPPESAQRTR